MSTTPPTPSYFSGISGASEAISLNPTARMKIALVGRVKTGKSWLACSMPGKKFVFDFDNRKESIMGKPDVVVKTYQDITQDKPLALAELEKDLKMFEYNKASGKDIPDVFVLDSATWWVKCIENDLMKSYSRLNRELKTTGGKALLIPAGYDVFTGVRNIMENVISRLASMGHVILVFHEEPEKDKLKSTKEEIVFTGKYDVHPWYLRTLLSTFNETWRLEIKNQKYMVQTKPSSDFGASTTLKIDAVEEADLAKILQKHWDNLAKGK